MQFFAGGLETVAKAGPKVRTPRNSPRKTEAAGLWHGFEPPPDFDDAALAEFNRLKATLVKLGRLDKCDPRLVCIAADLFSLVERARAELKGKSMTLETANGTFMPHPMLGAMSGLTMRLRTAIKDLGLSARDLKDSAVKSDDGSSPWDGLLNVAS